MPREVMKRDLFAADIIMGIMFPTNKIGRNFTRITEEILLQF